MLREKKLEDAIKAYKKGRKVVVIQEFEDGSLYTCPMEEYIDDKTHFLVDVPATENPDWNKAMHEMVTGGSQKSEEPEPEETELEESQPEEPTQEETQTSSGGGNSKCP